jgi:hypothetical protein
MRWVVDGAAMAQTPEYQLPRGRLLVTGLATTEEHNAGKGQAAGVCDCAQKAVTTMVLGCRRGAQHEGQGRASCYRDGACVTRTGGNRSRSGPSVASLGAEVGQLAGTALMTLATEVGGARGHGGGAACGGLTRRWQRREVSWETKLLDSAP